MNFKQFQDNVNEMEKELSDKDIPFDEVKIEYTRFDGYHCLWTIHEDNIINYFKW